MFLLNACILVGVMLSLPRSSYQECILGKPEDCLDAEFAPGTNLAGEGFDITKMERKGAFVLDMTQWKRRDESCTLCRNPYQENKKQKLPLSVVDWRSRHSCSGKVSGRVHQSSESLVNSITSSVENNWQINLDVTHKDNSGSLMLAGTDSKLAEYSMQKTKNDKFSFTSHNLACEYYSYRVSSSPKLHQEFKKAIKQLPKTYSLENKHLFSKLINDFGTHYLTKVKLGGSVQSVTSVRQCQASLEGLSVEEVQMCLAVEASATVKATIKTEAKHCRKDAERTESKSSFSDMFRDRFTEIRGGHTTEPDLLFSADKNPSAYKEWLNTLQHNPDILSYSLAPLQELLPKGLVRKNLRLAISHYILEKGLWKNCSAPCQAGIKSDSRDSCVCQCHNQFAVNQNCCPTRKGTARVIVKVERAANLWGDHTTATDGYVKVFFNKQLVHRTPVVLNNNNPYWASVVNLGDQDLTAGHKVRFEVWDEDNKWDDDLLGECSLDLYSGVKQDLCVLQHGRLFFRLEGTCAPSLGGPLCADYKQTPMTQSLKSLYVSRHAHPIPMAVLRRMGVFVNETSSKADQNVGEERKFNATHLSVDDVTLFL